MMRPDRKRQVTGAGLVVIGVLFLLVSNNLLLGWGNVWPLFPILIGMLLLRVYTRSRSPEMLFGGVATLLMGVFLLFFSLNIFPWSRMDALWPVIPGIAGAALLGVAAHQRGTGPLISGVVVILFAFLGLLHEAGVIDQRVIAPFIRLWPLVLIVAGVVLLRTRPAAEDADMEAIRGVIEPAEPAGTTTGRSPEPDTGPDAAEADRAPDTEPKS
ncbi:MAG: hypothetical protein PVF33_02650 [Candidatus Latescibacterota bacterium]